jgi:CRP/FNR family cyclic AMP-dependent transcriptional regulator
LISEDELRRIAAWSNDLTPEEFEEARRGTSIKAYGKGAYVCHVGDRLEILDRRRRRAAQDEHDLA